MLQRGVDYSEQIHKQMYKDFIVVNVSIQRYTHNYERIKFTPSLDLHLSAACNSHQWEHISQCITMAVTWEKVIQAEMLV